MKLVGIDYGSRFAGTTVWAGYDTQRQECVLHTLPKSQDVDAWLLSAIPAYMPDCVGIDAPLSLPKVYRQPNTSSGADYFYREGDRILGAMSPMFLGGLTARAMRLSVGLAPLPIIETYPAAQAKRLALEALGYKKDKAAIAAVFGAILGQYSFLATMPPLDSWHSLDAVLALVGVWRYAHGEAQGYGSPAEGQIWV